MERVVVTVQTPEGHVNIYMVRLPCVGEWVDWNIAPKIGLNYNQMYRVSAVVHFANPDMPPVIHLEEIRK